MRSGILRGISLGACVAIAAGPLFSLPAYAGPGAPGVAHAGPLLAWGDNQFGELGDGTVMNESAPIAVNPPGDLRVGLRAGDRVRRRGDRQRSGLGLGPWHERRTGKRRDED